jgi:hypothetical protein
MLMRFRLWASVTVVTFELKGVDVKATDESRHDAWDNVGPDKMA